MTLPENRAEDPVAKRALIERILKRKKALAAESLDVQQRPEPIPMSFAQERLWYVEQLGTAAGAYNISGGVRLEGALDIAALERALSEIVARHEALRTRFASHEDQGVQIIDTPVPVKMQPIEIREAELKAAMHELANAPFDLGADALYRFRLFRIEQDVHVLGIVLHHIVSDGWSIGVLIREMAALYGAFAAGEASPLEPLPIQYADYAIWQRRVAAVDGLAGDLAYWRDALAGAAPSLDLPTDRPRPAVQSSHGASVGVSVPERLVAALTQLAQREGATLFMVLLSAWQIVLGKWSGQDDIVVGSPIAGRNHAKVEPLIGFFINTVALRTDVSGGQTFKELLGRVRKTTLDAYAHQAAPFDRVIAEIRPDRDMSRHPVFQVLFVLQNLPERKLALPGLRVSSVGDGKATTKMDVSVNLTQTKGLLRGWVEYAADLFDASTVNRLMKHWLALLEYVAADADCQVADLPLLAPSERARILDDWRGTRVDHGEPGTLLHHLFEQWARRTPEAVAVIAGERQLSYGELDRRANALAQSLRAAGVGPDRVVGLRIDRSAELLIGLLGILKAGGAYLPLDPALPRERANYMVTEAGACALVTCDRLDDPAIAPAVRRFDMDSQAPVEDAGDGLPEPRVSPSNLACVVFTSGSTGQPKGVMMPHEGVVNYLRFLWANYALESEDRVLNVATIGFDASIRDFFGPLGSGAAAVLVTGAGTLDAGHYWRVIVQHRITRLLSITPSFLRVLCQAAASSSTPHRLREILTSGEALDAALVSKVRATMGKAVRVVNQYGPTECTMTSTWSAAGDETQGTVAIGRPLPNASAYVLDKHMAPVPVGVTGELYIGGVGLTRGYLGRPDLTAERFVPNPFGEGERLYRTGDHVRWDAEGQLHYLGRTDFQVKLRGIRVELNEIVSALNALPEVEQSAVLVQGEGDEQRLVAYFVAVQPDLTVEGIVAQLKTRLPDALIPNAFVPLDTIPLTPNGKLDRNALPALEKSLLRSRFSLPQSEAEHAIAEIFSSLLGVERVGRDDNFFMLGGHSLLAIRVVARIEDSFGVRPALRTLFERPTVSALADEVKGLTPPSP